MPKDRQKPTSNMKKVGEQMKRIRESKPEIDSLIAKTRRARKFAERIRDERIASKVPHKVVQADVTVVRNKPKKKKKNVKTKT